MAIIDYKNDMCNEEKVLMAVVRAAETFKRVISTVFRNYDLSFPQYNVLRVLDASKNGQSRITHVSQIMLVPGANMTGIAKRLEKNGFILRKSDPGDERVKILEITQKGKETLANIERDRDLFQEKILKRFSQREKEELLSGVKKLIQNSLDIT
jgi:DNA-binding MarR family transcriptional regulator